MEFLRKKKTPAVQLKSLAGRVRLYAFRLKKCVATSIIPLKKCKDVRCMFSGDKENLVDIDNLPKKIWWKLAFQGGLRIIGERMEIA